MKKYRVTWEIEVDAEDPDGATIEALDCIINGTARVFTATDGQGISKEVDLMEYGNGGAKITEAPQIVPAEVKRSTFGCNTCLCASCECKDGSKYRAVPDWEDMDGKKHATCGAYTYYD